MRRRKDRLAVQNMASPYYAILYSVDSAVLGSSSAKPGGPTLYYTLTNRMCSSGKLCKTWQAAQNHRLPASPPAKSSNLESRGKEKHFKGKNKGKNTPRD